MIKDKKKQQQFQQWAEHAVTGLKDSGAMLGIWSEDGHPKYEFQLHVGHCLCTGKPLVLVIEEGKTVPPKLLAAATVVEYFQPDSPESMKYAVERGYRRLASRPS